jgi:PII-like signaling protein
MTLAGEQVLLRIYLRSGDRAPLTPTHELLLKAARAEGLAGATALRGIAGFGHRGEPIRHSRWGLIDHVPVVIEIVDAAERIAQFVRESLAKLMAGRMITLERAAVMMYRQRKHEQATSLSLGALLAQPLSSVPLIEMSTDMTTNHPGVLLRIFIGESDRGDGGKPLYETIVQRAREVGLSGATVLRGSEGFGANSVVHKAKLLEMSSDLPIVIEMVDVEPKIHSILPWLESAVREGMITMEHVQILAWRHDPSDAPPQQRQQTTQP